MELILRKTDIPNLLEFFSKNYSFVNFQKDKSQLSAKNYFLPPKEKLFSYSLIKKKPLARQKEEKTKTLIFGLDPIDLEALGQLNEIMSKPKEDYFYFQRKNNFIVVGLSEYTLKESVSGADLMLEKMNEEQYQVIPLTKNGKEIAKNKFFKKEAGLKLNYPAPENNLRNLLRDSELLAEAIAWSKEHPLWEELGKTCLGCGICTYLCPLCYCFYMEDEIDLHSPAGESVCHRFRCWDACTLNNFSQVAGGKNFRPTLKNRYYDWFYHKFVRAYKEFGKSQCVGCGRCQKYCPAGIDIEKVLTEIIKDYKKMQSKDSTEK